MGRGYESMTYRCLEAKDNKQNNSHGINVYRSTEKYCSGMTFGLLYLFCFTITFYVRRIKPQSHAPVLSHASVTDDRSRCLLLTSLEAAVADTKFACVGKDRPIPLSRPGEGGTILPLFPTTRVVVVVVVVATDTPAEK